MNLPMWKEKLRRKIPWWGIILAKLILSRLPISYKLWKKVGLFVHGEMDNPMKAIETFLHHFKYYKNKNLKNFTMLELGPGDSVASAVLAYSYGTSKTFLIDVADFAAKDLKIYKKIIELLSEREDVVRIPEGFNSFEDLLRICNAVYLTQGLQSIKTLPNNSVDFVFSNAVLEHIYRDEFYELIAELYRITKVGGIQSHTVDLQDHIKGSLNNLRFSSRVYDSYFFRHSGFYTNRIRYSQMLQFFREVGFQVKVVYIEKWESLPISKNKLHKDFRNIPDEELKIRAFHVLLRKH